MKLLVFFALLTCLAVYGIDSATQTSKPNHKKLAWGQRVYVRMEGKFCPLYFPEDDN